MKKIFVIASVLLLAAGCSKTKPVVIQPAPVQTQPASPDANQGGPATTTTLSLPIKYNNKQYGFIFSLPQGWKDFTIYTHSWIGYSPDGNKTAEGPLVYIRNPKWTEAKPYEDIPVMVFTLVQWDLVSQERMTVSAAPFGPSELGRNKTYVFALPPRYDYDFRIGYQEVEKIMQNNPLQGY